jgi:hypothetical protein
MRLVDRTLGIGLFVSLFGCGGENGGAANGSHGGAAPTSGGTLNGGSTNTGGTNAGGAMASGGSSGGSSTSGGTSSPGGSSGNADGGTSGAAGNTAGGSAGSGGIEPNVILPCDSLAEVGEWEEITPPEVDPGMSAGTTSFAVDPLNSGTVYLGAAYQGIYKTTDCGASWIHVNTGTNASAMDGGIQWTFKINPENPNILYANTGYGWESLGLFKSTNAGVDWTQIAAKFAGDVLVNRDEPDHLLLSFHENCGPYENQEGCVAESTDGGATWDEVYGDFSPQVTVYFLENSSTWLVPDGGGLQRTTDRGVSWAETSDLDAGGHSAGFMHRADDGVFYLGTPFGIARSPDGATWTLLSGTGSGVIGVTGSATQLFAAPAGKYLTSSVSDGLTWTELPAPPEVFYIEGGELDYDRGHAILYSSNLQNGFWRVKTQ